MTTCLQKARRGWDSSPIFSLIRYNTHTLPWIITSTIQTNRSHHLFFIRISILTFFHSHTNIILLTKTMFLLHKWKWFRCCSWLYFFQLCSNTEQISQVLKTQKKLSKSHCCCSNQPLSKLYCYFAWYVLFKVTTFLFSAAVCPQWWSICVTYFCWTHVLLECC